MPPPTPPSPPPGGPRPGLPGASGGPPPPGYRYGRYRGGPDPLAAPFDGAGALDELGDRVLDGATPREALRDLLRQGPQGRRGLDDLQRRVRERQRSLRQRSGLDGTLTQVRRLLDTAVGQERADLFADPDDGARLVEAELDALPADPARAVRQLADYSWRSPAAAETYQRIRDLLRREVLDSQFRGLKQSLQGAGGEQFGRVTDMLDALNNLLEADARGEDTSAAFSEFLHQYGEFFPEQPASLEELIDSLARRAAAAQRLLESLTPEQRHELADLMAAAWEDLGLAAQMSRLQSGLRAARPDLNWGGRRRGGEQTGGRGEPLGLGDATTALEELAELDELAAALAQDYPGASLEDVDPDAVRRALGRAAVDDLDALARLEQELTRQGYLNRSQGRLELTPRAVRRLGLTALARVFRSVSSRRPGGHDTRDAGAAGDLTGGSRPWQFGDEQPLDTPRTLRNALRRTGTSPTGTLRLDVSDFEVTETERRSTAAVCLLVDLSYSMALRGTWSVAKTTALALQALIALQFPQDAFTLIGFSDYARILDPAELPGLDVQMVQGTNLQHALLLAGRELGRHPGAEPVVLVVTDGEPTAHLRRDGAATFAWPPEPETLEATLAEVDRLTRRGATINVFMLDDEPRLVSFVAEMARRNGGRVLTPSPAQLGGYVIADYVRTRRGRRAGVFG